MHIQRVHQFVVGIAAAVCLLFTSTLIDWAPYFLFVHELAAQPVPSAVGERDATLDVVVHDPSGAPITGARVTVLHIRDGVAYLAGFRETDATGRAHFQGLPRGVAWLLADAVGRGRTSTQLVLTEQPREVRMLSPPAHRLAVDVTDGDDKPIEGARVQVRCSDPLPFLEQTDSAGRANVGRLCPPPYAVQVEADGYDRSARVGVTPAAQAVRFRLRRLGWIQVHVADQNDEPAPLSTILVAGPGLWPARQTQSNAFGRSKISGLAAGTYDVRAVRGDSVSPITTGVMVSQGKESLVKLTLREGRRVLVQVVGGRAKDAPPVPDAAVVLVEEGLSSFPLEGRTAADGTVRLGPLPACPLSASARAQGYVGAGTVAIGADENEARVALLQAGKLVGDVVDSRGFPVPGASIEVVGTDLAGLPIAETPSMVAFRRAHFAWALQGAPALIPAGELGVMPGPVPPIPHAGTFGADTQVVAAGSEPEEGARPWVTDGDGEFAVGPIPPGSVSAIVRHPAYVETMSEAVSLAPGGQARVHIVLHAGGTLEGLVKDDRGFAIAGAIVRAAAKDGVRERTTLTAEDGTFAFSAVAPVLIVTASRPEAPDKISYEQTLEVGADERKEVEIVLGRERPSVNVQVIDDRGYPVDGAKVRVISLQEDVSLRRTSFTNKQGAASIEDAAGLRLRLEVAAPGYGTLVDTIAKAPVELKLKLARGLRVEGSVTGRGGRDRVQGATVTVHLATGVRQLLTERDGSFRVEDLASGPLRVRVDHEAYVAVERTFDVKMPTDVERSVQLEAIELELGGAVEGEVVDDRGNPVAGARVANDEVPEVLPVGPLPPGVVGTNERGEFRLTGLAEGQVTLEARAPGIGQGKQEDIAVRRERTTARVRIELARSGGAGGPALSGGLAIALKEAGAAGVGVLVASVAAGSEAERAGVAPGDVVVRIDGVIPGSVNDAKYRLQGPPKREVLLEVQRGKESVTLRVPREQVRK
ncbi:MAG: carboxypeptidase regulatory-like domain-containing protein [Polyangiaceae bacterium]|nr:carboxypeptidase regulatory-like domain-containing protein [Polyangiaceae bacterium]